ncbi:MAG: chloride transporter [Planctomycetota bacterium]|jgi:chorismate mutase/prephenate dehydratase|nr:chloride transporter [Planctomycetota bacterium]
MKTTRALIGKIDDSILDRLCRRGDGKLSASAIVPVRREISSASRPVRTRIKVAYLGPEGTFTHQAVLARFGSSADFVASQTIDSVFDLVKNHTVDYAVLPVENTLQGVVGQTVDLLGKAGLPLIVDEIVTPINFVLASRCDTLDEIRRIYSKREAFPQCAKFLNQPALARVEHVHSTSTAEAARQAASEPGGAALSPGIAATMAGLPIRFRNVENNARNKTRFLVLGHRQPERTGHDQTSVFGKVRNVVGGLVDLLRSFSDRGINLTRIESRPMDDAVDFESWFYINFDGHIDDEPVREIIAEHDMIWLGSFRRRDGGMPR